MNFVRVIAYDNWCEFDCYGKPEVVGHASPTNMIKHGDKIELMWPDGTIESTKVSVIDDKYEISDMGTPAWIYTSTAFIKTKIHGQNIDVTLRDTKIKVRKL